MLLASSSMPDTTKIIHPVKAVSADEIIQALSNREFSVHYQPQVDASRGCLVGSEALLRWVSPERGNISPGVFIPVAESSGLIHDIWHYLLDCVASDQQVHGMEANLHIAVNLSSQQLPEAGLAERFESWLCSSGLDSSQVHIEITESSLLKPGAVLKYNLDHLRALGIPIWLDDFGTGYSSLRHLRDLPISGLKVDQSFVYSLQDNLDDYRIVRAIVAMANSLGLCVIAEGVEKQEQAQILTQLGCNMLQGYLIGRPAPMTEMVRTWGKPCE